MKIIVTGVHGTIGKVLKPYLENKGHWVVGWDKINTYPSLSATEFIKNESPDFVIHLAYFSKPKGIENEAEKVNLLWTQEIAQTTNQLNIGFLFCSSALVFSNRKQGPFDCNSIPDAGPQDGEYAYHKRLAEESTLAMNPNAHILRLGWQIGNNFEGNNMLAYFEDNQRQYGKVKANIYWKPACSFIDDTVSCIENLMLKPGGTYMFDSNENFSLYEISMALNKAQQNRWNIEMEFGETFDQRLIDEKIAKTLISRRLNEKYQCKIL